MPEVRPAPAFRHLLAPETAAPRDATVHVELGFGSADLNDKAHAKDSRSDPVRLLNEHQRQKCGRETRVLQGVPAIRQPKWEVVDGGRDFGGGMDLLCPCVALVDKPKPTQQYPSGQKAAGELGLASVDHQFPQKQGGSQFKDGAALALVGGLQPLDRYQPENEDPGKKGLIRLERSAGVASASPGIANEGWRSHRRTRMAPRGGSFLAGIARG